MVTRIHCGDDGIIRDAHGDVIHGFASEFGWA